ncbi:MAG: tRNA (adenosine(37)-N6)-threonylcarbamoyltransferase complex ATPase subunit type 1 TsaE [Dehalococcoidia bacterium]|jgi:tRNA threonylcarbamoyladenosine biosynthesis protein TsaE|nr:tRNA (adenosine(37)-N6)-threonylcarbamoyltransferase complex ATPase subunit type 1 TsaE [Dehalococcoidia bacterium]
MGPISNPAWTVVTGSADETRAVGEALGRALLGDEIVLLIGQLGAGKTTLTQGLAVGLGIDGYTKSPSFVLMNEYRGRVPLYHLDLFRIETPEEVWDLGIEEYIGGLGVVAVEWADRVRAAFPEEAVEVEIEVTGEDRRRIAVMATGEPEIEAVARAQADWLDR